MAFKLNVPLSIGEPLTFTIEVGQIVYILGANGTGKSSLIQKLYSEHRINAKRISAHRQTWFQSNVVSLSPQEKKHVETNILSYDTSLQARWMEQFPAQRASIAIYDLIDAENIRARSIAGAIDEGETELALKRAKEDAPIKVINELLRQANLPIEISVRESDEVVASRSGGPKYSISQLSDGERNALLIAASVLTVKGDTILFIDEPERHLHRSIISPLLSLLFKHRTDCAFVVSTHDIMLPLDNPDARTLLVRGCTYNGDRVSGWDADLVSSEAEIDELLKRDILGSRRTLLFVEGTDRSLDKPLYSLLFPQASVIANSTCRDVERAVTGIRDSDGLHWVHAFGIVDNDRRPLTEIERLHDRGVYAVPMFSVESIYYHPMVLQRVAERQVSVIGGNPYDMVRSANAAGIAAVKPHIQRLSERVVETAIRRDLMAKLPGRSEIAAAQPIRVCIDVPAIVAEEAARLSQFCNDSDLLSIIARYPVRETPALGHISSRLGFQNTSQYEGAVRKLLMDDQATLLSIQNLFGTLAADIARGW